MNSARSNGRVKNIAAPDSSTTTLLPANLPKMYRNRSQVQKDGLKCLIDENPFGLYEISNEEGCGANRRKSIHHGTNNTEEA